MRVVYEKDHAMAELKKMLTKPAFDQVELSLGIQKSIEQMFGKKMSAKEVVDKIVSEVRSGGDAKVLHYSNLIDKVDLATFKMKVSATEIASAYQQVDEKVLAAIKKAIANVKKFHEEQMPKNWLTNREHGALLGQKNTAVDRVGIYVPGGTASYPSSVIMNAVPAKVAGVEEIIMVVPPNQEGKVNPYVLVVADLIGVQQIFKVGGAQAIAALAFGTESIPKVDKITGPGNIFVTLAKKEVYGHCDIDMLAGPSEILILADETAQAKNVAADLLGQAEHDPLASSILITDSEELAKKTLRELELQLEKLPRKAITKEALDNNGLIIISKDMNSAIELANFSAPEHLEVMTKEPFSFLTKLKHAGAIFLGAYSPEPLGDYYAGPNHVLPTGSTAKFYSVLNVETFMKKTSIIAYTEEALQAVQSDIIAMAEAEGLTAHANAIRVRFEK